MHGRTVSNIGVTTPTVIPATAANKVAHLYLEHQSQPNPMRLELLTVLLNHSSVQELNSSNHRQLQHLGVLRLEMLVPINPTHLDQHLVLLKQGIIWANTANSTAQSGFNIWTKER